MTRRSSPSHRCSSPVRADGKRLAEDFWRPVAGSLIVRTTQMEAAVTEDTVPIQNDFPTYEREKRDRSEP